MFNYYLAAIHTGDQPEFPVAIIQTPEQTNGTINVESHGLKLRVMCPVSRIAVAGILRSAREEYFPCPVLRWASITEAK